MLAACVVEGPATVTGPAGAAGTGRALRVDSSRGDGIPGSVCPADVRVAGSFRVVARVNTLGSGTGLDQSGSAAGRTGADCAPVGIGSQAATTTANMHIPRDITDTLSTTTQSIVHPNACPAASSSGRSPRSEP